MTTEAENPTGPTDPEMADGAESGTRRLRVVLLCIVALVVLAVVAFSGRFGTDPNDVKSALVGEPLPDVGLIDFDTGSPVDLLEVAAANEVVVVNFWAPWCTACVPEHLELNAASVALADEPVAIVGVSVHSEEREIQRFLDQLGQGYPILLDPGFRAGIDFGVFGVPETFFVAADGTVAARITGPVDGDLVLSVVDRLRNGLDVDSQTTGDTQSPP